MASSANGLAYISAYNSGWAYLVIDRYGYHGKRGFTPITTESGESGKTDSNTTLFHALLHLLQDHSGNLTIRTNSKYIISTFTEWIEKWIDRGFCDARGYKLTNANIVQAVYHMMTDRKIKFEYSRVTKSDKYKVKVDQEAYVGFVTSDKTSDADADGHEFRGRIN